MGEHDPGSDDTEVLPADRMTTGIVRRGDRVWRPMGPWSPAVHEYLRHLESAGFAPVNTGYRFHPHRPAPGEVVCHGDLGPWNTVYRNGLPAGFIDWDSAGPASPLTDLADAAWAFVPLAPPEQLIEAGFERPAEMAGRLAEFVAAYGLAEPPAILPELARCRLAGAERIWYLADGPAGAADSLEHLAGQLRWIDAITAELRSAL